MASLSDWWTKYSAENPLVNLARIETNVGMLPAVLSQTNRGPGSGFVQRFAEQNGKKRTAKYKYRQRKLNTLVKATSVDGSPNYCAPGETPTYLEAEQTVSNDVYYDFFIKDEELRDYEENFNQVFNDALQDAVNPLLEKLNLLTLAAYDANRGNTSAGNTTPISAQGFSSLATRTVNHAFKEAIFEEFRKHQYTSNKIMVGDGNIASYYRMLADGAPNADRGQQNSLNIMRDLEFYDDTQLDGALSSTNGALVWRPGAFQMLEWFKNVGDFRKVQESRVDDVITINLGGIALRFDMYMRYTHCDDDSMGLQVTLRKHYDFWSFPADFFSAGDPLNGTNAMLRFAMTTG